MLIDYRENVPLGVPDERAAVVVPIPEPPPGTAFPLRRLERWGVSLFELNPWCGTCPALFKTLTESETADLGLANEHLRTGLDAIDDRVLRVYGDALPKSEYTALLLEVSPTLVRPGSKADYFSHEQVATWGLDPVVGAAEDPSTLYYRTFETPIGGNKHLYELVVPMVSPAWNDGDRVAEYLARETADRATAVAYSLLDVLQPAMAEGEDYYEHWVLTHFLLDGHHKFEAAAKAERPVRLLSLVDQRISIAAPADLAALVQALSRPRAARKARQ